MEVAARLRWHRSGYGTLSHDEVVDAVLEAGLVDVVTTLLVDASVAAVAVSSGWPVPSG